MKLNFLTQCWLALAVAISTFVPAGANEELDLDWRTVINNKDLMPPLDTRNFNSYNPPSVNRAGLVVVRARSRGGPPLGPPTHGIYARDMSRSDSGIYRILDRTTKVPEPNNLDTTFVETPSFPRIDMDSDTIATRGNHRPVHRYYLDDGSETRAGTTGIYTNPFGELITGAAKLGDVHGYRFYRVPEFTGIRFEVFPGAPSVTGGSRIAFKGNYTVNGIGKTGVYYRDLWPGPSGGDSPAVLIANNTDTLIPGTTTVFGSTAPPDAARGKVVFAGFDNEDAPGLGGIYMARLQFQPQLRTLVRIGGAVPEEPDGATFSRLGEGMSFDGRHVAFWGAWGERTRTERLYCAEEGNRDMIAYCNQSLVCADSGETLGDPNSVCDDESDPRYGSSCYVDREVPARQGIFVHDIKTNKTHVVAKTGKKLDDFLFWKYSGKPPCAGQGHSQEGGEDDGESVRWRSSAFVAVGGPPGAAFKAAFKARRADGVLGIYLRKGPGHLPLRTVLDTTMDGQVVDSAAPAGSTITELGLERESLRGSWLAINAKMGLDGGEEEDDMAGIYLARLR